MHTKFLAAAALSFIICANIKAQDKVPPPPPPSTPGNNLEEQIIIRKKGNKKEKMDILIDGDKITLNGKPIDQLNDKDIEIIKGNADAIRLHRKLMAPGSPMMPMMIKSDKPFLGVSMEKAENGVKVTEVSKESAAEKAGIKTGDIITKLGNNKIITETDLQKAIATYKPGDEVNITFLRNGKEQKATAKLQANNSTETKIFRFNNDDFNFDFGPHFEEDFMAMSRKPKLGLTIQDVEEGSGVKVIGIDENSVAAKSGLQKDDVVTKINDQEVKNVDDLRAALKDVKEGDSFSIEYNRKGIAGKTNIKFPKKLKTANL
ncbi:MAG: PDZ domain-containing protein [Sphingobacteriia bacterium]|nr:PDZ domain-containing protein [Sphingobacteriia bacterium]